MNNSVNRTLIVFILCAMTGISTAAKERRETITFYDDIKIDGTLVKKGNYRLTFNDETGELTISRNGTTVAKTMARMEKREGKAARTEISSVINNGTRELRSITFRGESQSLVVGATSGQTNAQN